MQSDAAEEDILVSQSQPVVLPDIDKDSNLDAKVDDLMDKPGENAKPTTV